MIHPELNALLHHCKLDPHAGRANFENDNASNILAELLVPAEGDCLVCLHGQQDSLPSLGFARQLEINGDGHEGPFRVVCPQIRVKTSFGNQEYPSGVIASPVNEAVTIWYGSERPVKTVAALINNFDFKWSNEPDNQPPGSDGERRRILRVTASGRSVTFRWRNNHDTLRQLVDAEVFRSTAFTSFTFHTWDDASDEELIVFASDIASLCTFAVGQHTGVPVLSFFDAKNHVIKRIIRCPVESQFRRRGILDDSFVLGGVQQLFSQCFGEHVRMRSSQLPWRKLVSYCGSIEDPGFLEQKFASLMMALEFFIKTILLEKQTIQTPSEIERLQLPDLIGIVRGKLRWDVPRHYTEGDLFRLLRNAVLHGGNLPTETSKEFREAFDRWRLFLFRRVLMRLGYDGHVVSPEKGYLSSSAVNDFSEEHNSFAYP